MTLKLYTPPALLTMLALMTLAAAPARAQLTVTLAPVAPIFAGSADQTLTFSATLTNNYPYPLYLNGDYFVYPPAPLTVDDTAFYDTFVAPAAPLAAGSVTTTDLFTVLVPANTPVNGYDGTFYITGGADALSTQAQSSTPFQIDVQAVPEASTTASFGLLLALGLSGMMVAARKKKQA